MPAPLPVLVADLHDEVSRDFLEQVARENEETWVPLVVGPEDGSTHVLEVYTPRSPEPLRLLAEPIGPPTEHGYPLRLSPLPPPSVGRSPAAITAAADPLLGRTLAGDRLTIVSLVGTGMMGAVYKAAQHDLGREVAVKVLHASYQRDAAFCARFHDEALAASRLDHPNLVRVFDFGQEADGLLYLSMEFVAGRTLREALRSEGPMPARRIADVMLQVCAGLGQAHARGIVHRDVKPDNVVLVMGQDDDGRPFEQVKVCDFGLALLRASDSVNQRFAGTPVYMSPEQCRGEELDERTDVYACGVMLYELATGTVPFLSEKPMVVINRHLTMPPPPLAAANPGADPRLDPIIQKALRKSRDERYASVRALRADLKELLDPPRGFDLARESSRVGDDLGPASAPPSVVSARRSPQPSPSQPPARVASAPADGRPSPLEVEVVAAAAPPSAERRPSRAPSSAPAWLEDQQDHYAQFLGGMASGEARAAEVSGSLVRAPKAWLTKLLAERDPRALDTMLGEVEAAARVLFARVDAPTLRAVSSTVHGIATDEGRPSSVRRRAALIMKVFAEPALLAPVAERLLGPEDAGSAACRTLLLQAGPAGAYALYGARVKRASSVAARRPFVDAMRALGEAAWPVVRAALERIPAAALTGGHPVGAALAEDLLLSVPALRDEAAAQLVARYTRATSAPLACAATCALGRLCAERAAPLFLSLLEAPDDVPRLAGIEGLRTLGALDEQAVRRLTPILAREVQASVEVLRASAAALASVTQVARALAVPLLAKVVRTAGLDDDTVCAAAASLLRVMGNEARAVVIGRSDAAAEPLRGRLLVLLSDPRLPDVEPGDRDRLL